MLPNEAALFAESRHLGSERVRAWEQAIASKTGSADAVAINSGRHGMELILEYLGLSQGDEVIVPAYTLGALIPLVQKFGAKVIPADVDAHSFNLTPESVAARATDRTRVAIVLHAFGAPLDVSAIGKALAPYPRAMIVEDCAHSLGATLSAEHTGNAGIAGFYSFEITKPINTYGGGMVVSGDQELLAHLRKRTAELQPDLAALDAKYRATLLERRLMSTGLAWPLLFALSNPLLRGPLGALYRSRQSVPSSASAYTAVQAHLGLAKLDSLDQRIAWRARLAGQYRALLSTRIHLQAIPRNASPSWYFLVAVLPTPAEGIREKLIRRGIDAAVGDEIADDVGAMLGYSDCPNAAHLFRHAIALPMHDTLPEAQVRKVCNALNALVDR